MSLDPPASPRPEQAFPPLACERCGDFAPLFAHDVVMVCAACLERLTLPLTGQVSLGKLLRDTFRIRRMLRGPTWALAALVLVGTLVRLLCAVVLETRLGTQLDACLDRYVQLTCVTFMAACVVAEVYGARRGWAHALEAAVSLSSKLAGYAVLVQLPITLELMLQPEPTRPIVGSALSWLAWGAGLFVPALLVHDRPSLSAALRDSARFMRMHFGTTLAGVLLLFGAYYVACTALSAVFTMVLVDDFLAADRATLRVVLALTHGLSTVLAAPLLAYGAVFLTLIVMQARARERMQGPP